MGQRCSGRKRSPQSGLNSSACSDDDDDYEGDGDDGDDDDDDDYHYDDDDDNAPGKALPLFSLPLVWNKPDLI